MFVSTRWLSRMESIDFILKKRKTINKIIEKIEEIELPFETKCNLLRNFTEENFDKILILGKLVFPFYVLIKIFEKNNSRQFLAVPCFEQLNTFIKSQLKKEELLEYHTTLLEFLTQLKIRKKKTLHWELLLTNFVLTLPGRTWMRKKFHSEHVDAIAITNKELQFQFKNLTFDYLEEDDGNLDRIDVDYFAEDFDYSSEGIAQEMRAESHEEEEEINDLFSYRSISLQHVNVPLPPSHLGSLYESILETLKEVSVRINGSDEFIDETFNFYVFNDSLFNRFCKFKNIRSHPEIGWHQEVLNQKMKNLANVAFHILPVLSSETSVERCFSQQKQILSELRLKTRDDLTNARFILAE